MDRGSEITVASREEHIKGLFWAVMEVEDGCLEKLEELSSIAGGGNELARKLIGVIDRTVERGGLILPWDIEEDQSYMGRKGEMVPPDRDF